MKLTACYTVFNGFELLENSINQIIDMVDNIIICYQTVSNAGNESRDIEAQIFYAFSANKKIKIIKYEPNLEIKPKQNEMLKHQKMVFHAKKLSSTHFVLLATDHYYDPAQFLNAKLFVERSYIDVSFTKMYTYYKNPTWQITPIENYMMPFIMRLYDHTRIEKASNYPVLVDPAVQVNTCFHSHVFGEDEIMLHHYSMVRKDVKNKMVNAASLSRFRNRLQEYLDEYENYDPMNNNIGIKYFQGRKVKIVPNYFNIKI